MSLRGHGLANHIPWQFRKVQIKYARNRWHLLLESRDVIGHHASRCFNSKYMQRHFFLREAMM